MGNLSHGASRLSSQFSKVDGSCSEKHKNVLVYIDDLLVHTATHDEHLNMLEKVFERLHANHLKVYLEKCVFGNQEMSYLGFTLTPEGINPGRNKLQAIKDAKPPTTIKMVRFFVGLCNFFRTHIKDSATITPPLFKVNKKIQATYPNLCHLMPFMLSKSCSNN